MSSQATHPLIDFSAATIRALFTIAVVLGAVGCGATAAGVPSEATLANGLRVRMVPVQSTGAVAVLLGARAGFFDEPAGLPHLAHVAEHLVVFGAPAGTDEAKAVDRWYRAGKVNGETLPGWMYFDLWVVPDELPEALRVQADRLNRREFSDAVLTREVPRALAELDYVEKSETSGPSKFAVSAFVQAAVHGRTEVAIKAVTRTFTVDDVRRFHARTFRPDRAMLVIVGDFDPSRALKAVEDAFGGAAVPANPTPLRLTRTPDGPITVRWDVSTRHLFLAWPAPPASSPDHAALTLAASVLSRRLALDPGVAALAKMALVSNEVEGAFFVNAQVKAGADPEALRARLIEQVRRLSTPEGLPDAEVDQARREFAQTVNPSPLRLLMLSAGGSPLMARTNLELQRMSRALVWGDLGAYAKRVEALDGATVRAALGRLLEPGKAVVVRVEPAR